MSLFLAGDFVLHSGGKADFIIDCGALTDEDLDAVAAQLLRRTGPFGSVEGVPTGGLRLAAAMTKLATPPGPLLVVDDVLTTGNSISEYRAGRPSLAAVIFARKRPPVWCRALFVLTEV